MCSSDLNLVPVLDEAEQIIDGYAGDSASLLREFILGWWQRIGDTPQGPVRITRGRRCVGFRLAGTGSFTVSGTGHRIRCGIVGCLQPPTARNPAVPAVGKGHCRGL